MITLRALVHGCWFNDHLNFRERDADGQMIFRCQRCGDVQTPDLRQDTLKGVAHTPAEVLGKPLTRTFRESQKTRTFGNWRA